MEKSNISDLIRTYFAAYESKDRQALEDLLSDTFTFSSPHDPHIGKVTYFERCWPNSKNLSAFHIEKLFAEGNEAFVRYECTPMAGAKFRNTEYFTSDGTKITHVEVYYGSLPADGVKA